MKPTLKPIPPPTHPPIPPPTQPTIPPPYSLLGSIRVKDSIKPEGFNLWFYPSAPSKSLRQKHGAKISMQRPRIAAHIASRKFCASHPVQRPRKCNQSAEVRASHPVQRPRSVQRKCNQSVEVSVSHPVQRPRSIQRKCNQSVEVNVLHPVQRPGAAHG